MVIDNFTHTKLIFKPKRDLFRLFLAGTGRKVAITFLALFSPIYIYQLNVGNQASSKAAIMAVVFYYLIIYLVKLVTLTFAEDLSREIGFKKTMWLSSLPFAFLILSLFFSQNYPQAVFVAAAFWGVHAGLFWWGYHGYFVKSGDVKHFGEGIGEADLIQTLAASLTPIIGAIAASYFGFMAPFMLAALFMGIALIFLGFGHDTKQKHDVKIKDVVLLMWRRKIVSTAYASFQADTSTYLIVWPLFLFLFFGNIISLGVIISVSAFIAGILGIIAGRKVDKQGEGKVVAAGSFLLVFSWIAKFLGNVTSTFVGSEVTRYFGFKFVDVSFGELTYKKASEKWLAQAMLFRELSFSLGGIFAVFFVGTFVYFGLSLKWIFLFVSAVSTMPLLAVYRGKIHDQ